MARQLYLPGTKLASQFQEHVFPPTATGSASRRRAAPARWANFLQITPAGDSDNLRHLAAQIESPCFLAHVRAAPGGTFTEQNAHPFVHAGWMFQHKGEIGGFAALEREFTMDVAPELYLPIRDTTDSEVCFFPALTFGLGTDPTGALGG